MKNHSAMFTLLERGFLKIMSKPRSGIAKLLTKDGPTLNMHWAGCFTLEPEFLRIGRTVNAMVDQLSSFAAEVIRVAREVGTDVCLGSPAVHDGAECDVTGRGQLTEQWIVHSAGV